MGRYLLSPNRDITYLDMKNICNDISSYYQKTDDTFDKCFLEFKHHTKHFIAIRFNNIIHRREYKALRISSFQYPVDNQNFVYRFFKVNETYNIINEDDDIIIEYKEPLKRPYGLMLHLYQYNEFLFSPSELKTIKGIFEKYGLHLINTSSYKKTIRFYD